MATKANPTWPVLTKYDQDHLARIALPLGGIGTGTVALGGRGDLRDWEVVNRPAKGFSPKNAFFALWAKPAGGPAIAKALEGPIEDVYYEGAMGCTVPNHNLPRFRNCTFQACYPLGQVLLNDPDVPVDVRIEGFNPLVPADADASSIPAAIVRFVLTNKTAKVVEASVCGSLENFLGTDGSAGKTGRNTNAFRTDGLTGIFMTTDIPSLAEQYGTFALATTPKSGVSFRTTWKNIGWGMSLLDFWDDFSADGKLDNIDPGDGSLTGTLSTTSASVPTGSLAASVKLAPKASKTVTFVLAWHFPNRMTWTPRGGDSLNVPGDIHRALTACMRTFDISDILPAPARLEGLACPDLATISLSRRTFDKDFADRHLDISAYAGDRVAYYVSRFECSEKMSLAALLGYDGPVKIWVDGKEIFSDPSGTNPARFDSGRAVFEAAAGSHEIVVGLGTNNARAWGIYLRLERTDVSAETISKGPSAYAMPNLVMEPVAGDCGCNGACGGDGDSDIIGNYYATQYRDAWDVAVRTAKDLPRLEARTLAFLNAFCGSDIPRVTQEAALYTLTGLRSQTTFRTPDGRLYGWEGCGDRGGCCFGSCTHVWNYEHATGFLFGELAMTMREVEFMHATGDNGLMSFRVHLPLGRSHEFGKGAADGQMGAIMRLYREWQLSGDEAMLRKAWPFARKALEFCWIPGGWDGDQDGVMEGCQHNTMDVEYYGPNGQMGIWYLGALRACQEMAAFVGDAAFADRCKQLFEKGSAWIDQNLFNGEFYEQKVVPPTSDADVAPGLRVGMGGGSMVNPSWQLGAACLVDQLVGQYTAHVLGLGYLVKPENVRKTLASIRKYNFKKSLFNHFNHLRTFVLNGEAATLMATYPLGRRPKVPFPYCNEVMTGFEYTAAIGMLQEGMIKEGMELIDAVRSRYTGNNRSPFDEAECGHHYARAMATWAAQVALTGFGYSGVNKAITFAAAAGKTFFWSNGYAWGTCTQAKAAGGIEVQLAVLHGTLTLKEVSLRGLGTTILKAPRTLAAGKTMKVVVTR